MSFIQQSFLWTLCAAAIPIIIHLMNRRRHRTVQWAAMAFLLKATQESRGKKRLKHILILACRTLAIIAIAFAIARPLLGGLFGLQNGKVSTIVLILDRSASMESATEGRSESRRLSILRRIKASLAEMDNPRLILIDSATGNPQEIHSPDILDTLSSTSATDTTADIPQLVIRAVDYLRSRGEERSEVWLASDLQRHDWEADESRWASARSALETIKTQSTLRILALQGKAKPNRSVQVTAAKREGDELVLDIEITRNQALTDTQLALTYQLNDHPSSEIITLKGQTQTLQKRFPLKPEDSGGYGHVSITPDGNERDNVSFFAYGENKPSLTCIVSEGGESEQVLQFVSVLPGFENLTNLQVSPNQTHRLPWQKTSLLLWQAPLPSGTIAEQMNGFLASGGTAIFFPPKGTSDTTFAGLQWGEISESPKEQYFIVTDWSKDDGPLRDGINNHSLPVKSIRAILRRAIQGDASSLAQWDDATPFLTRSFIGKGIAYFCTSLPDYDWSNLADGEILVPMVLRSIETGTERFGSGFHADVGSARAKAADGETRQRLDSFLSHHSSNADFTAGVWQLGERTVATNRPSGEDNLESFTQEDLDGLFQSTPYQLFEETGEEQGNLVQEVWEAFLIAMLVFLIIEAILCLQPKTKT